MLVASKELVLQGACVAFGIGIGPLFFLPTPTDLLLGVKETVANTAKELCRFQCALDAVAEQIQQLQRQSEYTPSGESVTLLGSQLQFLFDPILIATIEEEITQKQSSAENALRQVVAQYQQKFAAIDDPFFSERFQDLRDISERLMGYLRGVDNDFFADMPQNAIVSTHSLAASQAIEAIHRGAAGFVTAMGTTSSHAAIIAKAKGIPYISQIDLNLLYPIASATAIVDGQNGLLLVNPIATTLRRYSALSHQIQLSLDKLSQRNDWPTETWDGYRVELAANVDMLSEVAIAHKYGASGIGLFRTEYLLLTGHEAITEAMQYEIYRQAAESMAPATIVIRSFDIGGDKQRPGYYGQNERNGLLGCRAIRFLLQEQELFKTQLRAILRANTLGNVALLFPMVSTLTELLEAKQLVRQMEQELVASGLIAEKPIKIGCMVEVPSAALIIDLLAKECDFLSIGTNDLVQYALAVDRDNFIVRNLYSAAHPSVLRLIKLVTSEAIQQGIPVTICGEVAADPRFTPLLLGLGIQEFSMAPRHLPNIKQAIRHSAITFASQLTEYVLTLSSSHEIEAVLEAEYQQRLKASS